MIEERLIFQTQAGHGNSPSSLIALDYEERAKKECWYLARKENSCTSIAKVTIPILLCFFVLTIQVSVLNVKEETPPAHQSLSLMTDSTHASAL
ncbi:hypothetical protein Q9966_006004 [Columba livia]|nr:hypothetical protein Q9966_006004 [Columba livia]